MQLRENILTATANILLPIVAFLAAGAICGAQQPKETAGRRHRRVAERREGIHIICHRGAVEFAHENTLEAFRAAFELGADGNEIDIRATKDGVLVCFHDDMIDHLLAGYGDVADYEWADLQRIPFRHPGRFGKHCRIPTLLEVFELHRRHAGLMHLDVKRPGLVGPISKLLDRLDMWDQVVLAPRDFTDPRYRPTPGKAGALSRSRRSRCQGNCDSPEETRQANHCRRSSRSGAGRWGGRLLSRLTNQ